MISKETIDLVRERCRIEEVAAKYIPSLKKAGKNFQGLCPFHKEKTPSFSVNPDRQIFHCFGCGEGGNVFTFIQKIENVSFPESVRIAGDMAGVPVRDEGVRNEEWSLLYRINDYAARLYHTYLLSREGRKGLDYLINRGLSMETVENFQLGYAPDSWNFLTSRLMKHKMNMEDVHKWGLAGKSEKTGGFFDQFRDRVMFPIKDPYGKVIAFGGRVMTDAKPKYINSPETPVFSKRHILYGYDRAKKAISEYKRVIVVEGYLDVIGCHQAGVENAVAPLGTALTEEHVRFLARTCREIILLFDGDSAGINASVKSVSVVKDVNVSVKVAELPDGMDPFEYISEKGQRSFMAVVETAKNTWDFLIDRLLASEKTDGKIKTMLGLFDVIKTMQTESLKTEYLKKISFALELDENSVIRDFSSYIRDNTVPSVVKNLQKPVSDFVSTCARSLVELLCIYPELIAKAESDFPLNEIKDPAAYRILSRMSELYSSCGKLEISRLFDFFPSGPENSLINQALNRKNTEVENPKEAYTDIYLNLRRYRINEKIREYENIMKKDPSRSAGFLAEIEILRRDLEKFSEYILYKKNTVNRGAR